jgi:hypothetical protein
MNQEKLKDLLFYEPQTGVFTWLKNRGGSAYKGTTAGRLHPSGHRVIRVSITSYYAHRLAWLYVYGEMPSDILVDHINGKRDDNRIDNLRLATVKQNAENRGIKHTPSKLQLFLKTREIP